MNASTTFHGAQRGLYSLLFLSAACLSSEDVMAKVAIMKPVGTGGTKRTYSGNTRLSRTHLDCAGYPTLITVDSNGKTQVYVNDGSATSNPEVTQQEAYRVEGVDNWTDVCIFGGATDATPTTINSVNIEMNGGKVGDIFLAGYGSDNTVTNANLTITGGEVNYISVVGLNNSPVTGSATITLNNMTYRGSAAINLVRYIDYEAAGEPEITSNITYTAENCKFIVPETDPYYKPTGDECSHHYYIKSVTPDPEFAEQGLVDVGCSECGLEWTDSPFCLNGRRDPASSIPSDYRYYVEQKETVVPATCVDGVAIYTLTMTFPHVTHIETVTYDYEGKIPPTYEIHNWDEDGACHETHYEVEYESDGTVKTDEIGNIAYVLNPEGIRTKSKREYIEQRPYIRMLRRKQYTTNEGTAVTNTSGQILYYEDWENVLSEQLDSLLNNFQNDATSTKKIFGFNSDVTFNASASGATTSTASGFDFMDGGQEGIYFELNGHTLSGGVNNIMVNSNGKPLHLSNGEIHANISNFVSSGPTLVLKGVKLYTRSLNLGGTNIVLSDGAEVFADADATLNVGSVTCDATSVYHPATGYRWIGDLDKDNAITSADALLLSDMLLQKRRMPSDTTTLDVNLDGNVDIADVIEILNVSLGKKDKTGIPITE